MLDVKDYPELYRILQAPVVKDVNCGSKCSEWNNGTPVCCENETTTPVLYTSEFEYLKDKLDAEGNKKWHKVKGHGLEVLDDEVLASCTGPSKCNRDNRSLVCRTFPFYPYITEAGELVGMCHYEDYDSKCWVLMNDVLVNPQFVSEFEQLWHAIFQKYPAEILNYAATSRMMYKQYAKKGKRMPIILFDEYSKADKVPRMSTDHVIVNLTGRAP